MVGKDEWSLSPVVAQGKIHYSCSRGPCVPNKTANSSDSVLQRAPCVCSVQNDFISDITNLIKICLYFLTLAYYFQRCITRYRCCLARSPHYTSIGLAVVLQSFTRLPQQSICRLSSSVHRPDEQLLMRGSPLFLRREPIHPFTLPRYPFYELRQIFQRIVSRFFMEAKQVFSGK